VLFVDPDPARLIGHTTRTHRLRAGRLEPVTAAPGFRGPAGTGIGRGWSGVIGLVRYRAALLVRSYRWGPRHIRCHRWGRCWDRGC
jgi:hypothetical protein